MFGVSEDLCRNFLVIVPGTANLQNGHIGQFQPTPHDILRNALLLYENDASDYRECTGRIIKDFFTVSYGEEFVGISPALCECHFAGEVERVGSGV